MRTSHNGCPDCQRLYRTDPREDQPSQEPRLSTIEPQRTPGQQRAHEAFMARVHAEYWKHRAQRLGALIDTTA